MTRIRAHREAGPRREEPTSGDGTSGRRLRIGIMLRGVDEIDGPGVYVRDLCDALFDLDDRNEYVLFYMRASQAGRYADRPNVTERVVRAPTKLVWDQVAIPVAAWREELDVLFHHKFTIPLLSPCPTVVQQRGVEYWTFPEWYETLDRLYATRAIPLYCRRADRVVTNSSTLADDLVPHIGVPREEIEAIHAAPDPIFRRVTDRAALDAVRERYGLPPSPFFLMVAKGYPSVGAEGTRTYPRKNVHGVIRAYRTVLDRLPEAPELVVAGPGFTENVIAEYGSDVPDRSRVHFPGFVEFSDMPALYSLAHALVFPSYSESFGIPLVEAMASGCPVVAADTAACPEIVADAGLLVDPRDADDIAEAMVRVVREEGLRDRLVRRGLERASEFSWAESAGKLLRILRSAAEGR